MFLQAERFTVLSYQLDDSSSRNIGLLSTLPCTLSTTKQYLGGSRLPQGGKKKHSMDLEKKKKNQPMPKGSESLSITHLENDLVKQTNKIS